ncbi:MAG TPA: hypothetical protein VNJ12_03035 [Candidatus Dormibacteraeota bacterium]|nr:hypothetical protein [Candidatus Dormibacteraeota bacterium]
MNQKAAWVMVAAAILFLAPASRAGTLNTDVIGLFPQSVGEFAYADMKSAQQYKWFPALQQQILPARFRQFEQFLNSVGIDPNTQVEDLAFGTIPASKSAPEEVLGVALGEFQPDAVETNMKNLKLPTRKSRGYTLYAYGSGASPYDIYFFFLDPNTAVFGQGDAIEKMLAVRMDGAPSLLANNTLFPLINQVNGQGLIWAALDQHYTQLGLRQMLPEVASSQQTTPLLQKIHAMTIEVSASSSVQTEFEAVCDTPTDANNFAALLQAGILYQRYQSSQSNPGLAEVLGETQVTPRGDRLDVNLNLTEDQLTKMIAQRTFAVKM